MNQPNASDPPPTPPDSVDIGAQDLDLDGAERPPTAEPDAYTDDGTLGGLGGSDATAGGAG